MAQRRDHVKAKRGDLIEISRGTFYHWAIYVGDGYVIHLTTSDGLAPSHPSWAAPSGTMSYLNGMGIVMKEKLSDVTRKDTFCVKNYLDNKYQPRSVKVILTDAQCQVGKKLPYNIIQRNCEHFVTDLRYGTSESRQVLQVAGVLGAATVGVAALGAVVAAVWGLLRIS